MFRNYLIVAFRNLWKEKFFSLISIAGMSIGIAISIIIFQIIFHEWSYDRFHTNKENIYRIISRNQQNSYPGFSSKLAKQLVQENPEIKNYTRIYREWSTIIKNPQNPTLINEEKRFIFADPSLFSLFSFPLIYGNVISILKKPYTVVISEKMAEKYFGKKDPIGKNISYNGQQLFEIVGVFKNIPTNSSIIFDFVSSLDTFEKINRFSFDNLPNFETFILVSKKESLSKLVRNIKVANKLIAPLNYNESDYYELEPLLELQLRSSYTFNEKSSLKFLSTLSVTALIILFLALFNYINLVTARATLRAKEIGVRKTIGASQFSIVKQFFLESTLISFLAFLAGIGLTLFLRGPFNTFFGFTIDFSLLVNKVFIVALIGLFVISTFLSGLYPALILSKFSPIKVLKGKYIDRSQGKKVRSIIIVFQFCVSSILILCSLLMHKQIKHMKDRDLGFNKGNLLIINLSQKIAQKSDDFKKTVVSQNGIEHVSLSDTPFFKTYGLSKFRVQSSGELTALVVLQADADFASNIGLKWHLIPNKNAPENNQGFYVTLNEMAVKKLGYTDSNIIGQRLLNEGGQEYGEIAGIVKDFNLISPQAETQPMLFLVKKSVLLSNEFRYMQVRLNRYQSVSDMVVMLEKVYHKYDSESPFQYSFLDNDFQKAFTPQNRIVYIVQFFTAVAILLSCLGLFGLMMFIGQTRSKEISIRKIMGASVFDIFSLLSKEFLILVILSVLIAIPCAYYLINQWLENFVYRVDINWWLFITGGLLSLLISLLTIGYQVLKTALSNPVNILRSE
ncbi:ABC transporter permease [Spirosoma lituiforme]